MVAARAANDVRKPTQAREKDGASVDARTLSAIMDGPSQKFAVHERRSRLPVPQMARNGAARLIAAHKKLHANWTIQSTTKRATTTARNKSRYPAKASWHPPM